MRNAIDPDSPGFLITTAARLMRTAFEREIERSQIGVTAGEARVLAHMSASGAMRQHHLAERLGVAAMSVTAFLDKLEALGLIERRADPDDRRAKIVTLTKAAAPILQDIERAGGRATDAAFAGVSAEDFDLFRRVCHNLCDNLYTRRCPQAAS